jgi:hypothetical protein
MFGWTSLRSPFALTHPLHTTHTQEMDRERAPGGGLVPATKAEEAEKRARELQGQMLLVQAEVGVDRLKMNGR